MQLHWSEEHPLLCRAHPVPRPSVDHGTLMVDSGRVHAVWTIPCTTANELLATVTTEFAGNLPEGNLEVASSGHHCSYLGRHAYKLYTSAH